MSREPDPPPPDDTGIELVVTPRSSELTEGFTVQRALPSARKRMVGPFVFLDAMGPSVLEAGRGLDVPPHPHIGLATLTYLFGGALLHRDSLGTQQLIRPGEVNWMTAGRGIVHSERTPPEARRQENRLFGVQAWVALPLHHEEAAPAFSHYPADSLPVVETSDKVVRLIVGSLYGERSPVRTLSEMFCADANLAAGSTLQLPAVHEERAAFVVEGSIEARGAGFFDAGRLVVFRRAAPITLRATRGPARLLLLGGEPLDRHRFVWWNFVSSSRERIEQAKEDWKEGRFPAVPGETEFIALPPGRPRPVQYP